MANQITKKLLLSTGGVQYELTVPEKIYDELGISQERFAELLSRDLYCPTLTAEPASTTLTYTDTDGSTNHFQVGQPCRWLSNGAYRMAICTNVTASAVSWYILPDTATIATKSDVQTLQTEVDKKVDKVTGKQLSTEDFTTALKDKLNSLSNYDDTTISNAVSTLRADFDKLVSGDTTEAIKTFNEVIAFLDGVKDTEDLESIIASIETQIAAKQDKLVSGTSIKTVNGVSLLGSGNIDTSYTDATQAAHGLMSVADKKKLDGITAGANPNVQPDWNETTTTSDAYIKNKPALAAVATSGSYNDLTNKPTIPSAVTESTVSGWGFTKNTGTYSKPSTGIPKTDLASDVQTSLGKADTALQSFTETDPTVPAWAKAENKPTYTAAEVGALPSTTTIPTKVSQLTNDSGFTANAGTITGINMNGSSKGTSGVVDLGTVVTTVDTALSSSSTNPVQNKVVNTALAEKQATLVSGTNIKTINGTSLLGSGDIAISSGGGNKVTTVTTTTTTISSFPANTTYLVKAKATKITISAFAAPSDSTTNAVYSIIFTSSSSGTTLSLPTAVRWANDEPPSIAVSTLYEFNFIKAVNSSGTVRYLGVCNTYTI